MCTTSASRVMASSVAAICGCRDSGCVVGPINRTSAPPNRMRQGGADVRLIGPTTQPLSRHPQIAATLEAMTRDADVVHIHALWEEIQHRAARAAQRLNVPYLF